MEGNLKNRIGMTAADIASRVQEMSRDSAINNAYLLERLIEECLSPELVGRVMDTNEWLEE